MDPNSGNMFLEGQYSGSGFLARNGKDFLCPIINFTIVYDSNYCAMVFPNVSDVFFPPLSFQWSTGLASLNLTTPVGTGSYTLYFNETGANGCPSPIVEVSAPDCKLSQPISNANKSFSTTTIIAIGMYQIFSVKI